MAYDVIVNKLRVQVRENLKSHDWYRVRDMDYFAGLCFEAAVEGLAAIDILRMARGESFALPVLPKKDCCICGTEFVPVTHPHSEYQHVCPDCINTLSPKGDRHGL